MDEFYNEMMKLREINADLRKKIAPLELQIKRDDEEFAHRMMRVIRLNSGGITTLLRSL